MWKQPELPAELAAMIDDETLDRFTVSGDADECARRMHALAAALPEVTGFRIKLPPGARGDLRRVRAVDPRDGEVIAASRCSGRTAALSA